MPIGGQRSFEDILAEMFSGAGGQAPAAPPSPKPPPAQVPYNGFSDSDIEAALDRMMGPAMGGGGRSTTGVAGFVEGDGRPKGGQRAVPITETPVGSRNFADELLGLWQYRKKVQRDREVSITQPGGTGAPLGPGGSASPYPDTFRWSPQSQPGNNIPGTAAPGLSPIRPPMAPIDPHPGVDVDAMTRKLRQSVLVPGQQPIDLSSPEAIVLPGVTHGQLPSPFVRNVSYGSGMNVPPQSSYIGIPGGSSAAPGWQQDLQRWYHETSPQERAWLQKNDPGRVPEHPINRQMREFGITPEFIALARAMQAAGEI